MDHRRILAWANRHLKKAEKDAYAFWGNNSYDVVLKHPYPVRKEIGKLRRRQGTPSRLPDSLVLTVGDSLHNMRVSLDYLAFRLVKRYTPTANERQIAFPICDTVAKYRIAEPRNLVGVPKAARQLIEGMQPYHGSHAPDLEPLAILDGLENVHKHRYILAAGPAITRVRYEVIGKGQIRSIWTIPTPSGPLKHGAVVVRATKDKTETKMLYRVQFHPCFAKSGPAGGAIVGRTLKRIRDHIRRDIFPALEPFL